MAARRKPVADLPTLGSGEKIEDWRLGRIKPMPDRVPKDWRLVPLVSVARLESGHTPSRKKPEYWNGGSIPWVSLHDSNEKPTRLGSLWADRRVVLVFARHFG